VMVENRAAEPIIPLRLFANHTITLVSIISVIAGAITLGMFFYFALYLQTLTGLSAAEVGFLFLPFSVVSMIVSVIAGRVIARTGRYKWLPVLSMAMGAVLLSSFVLFDAHTPIWVLAIVMGLMGASMGLQFQVLMVAIQAAAPAQDIGAATGVVTQARTIGAALGLAINGAVMSFALTQQDTSLPADALAQIGSLTALDPATVAGLDSVTRETVLAGYSSGFHTLFLFIAAIYVVETILALMLKDIQIPTRA
jgi:predicted MFS family arabinose efflux permease